MTEAPFVGTEIRQEPIQSVVLVTEIQAAECFYFATRRVLQNDSKHQQSCREGFFAKCIYVNSLQIKQVVS